MARASPCNTSSSFIAMPPAAARCPGCHARAACGRAQGRAGQAGCQDASAARLHGELAWRTRDDSWCCRNSRRWCLADLADLACRSSLHGELAWRRQADSCGCPRSRVRCPAPRGRAPAHRSTSARDRPGTAQTCSLSPSGARTSCPVWPPLGRRCMSTPLCALCEGLSAGGMPCAKLACPPPAAELAPVWRDASAARAQCIRDVHRRRLGIL